jgi:hypothetical protein
VTTWCDQQLITKNAAMWKFTSVQYHWSAQALKIEARRVVLFRWNIAKNRIRKTQIKWNLFESGSWSFFEFYNYNLLEIDRYQKNEWLREIRGRHGDRSTWNRIAMCDLGKTTLQYWPKVSAIDNGFQAALWHLQRFCPATYTGVSELLQYP